MNNDPYSGILQRPDIDFNEVRDGRRSALFYYDVDLSGARSVLTGTQLVISTAGDSIYVDKDPSRVGNATVHFQDITLGSTPAPVYCEPGFIAKVPFSQLLIENLAQPGKIFRFFYGIDIDFTPGSSTSISISNASLPVKLFDDVLASQLKSFSFNTQLPASLANYGTLEIFNPVGSGKTLEIKKLDIYFPSPGLAVVSRNVSGFPFYAGSVGVAFNRTINAAPNISRFGVTQAATLGSGEYGNVPQFASGTVNCVTKSPILIPAGFGITASSNIQNTSVTFHTEFNEI